MKKEDYRPEKLREWRSEKEVTQQAVADAIGYDRQSVFRVEHGKQASWSLLKSLCRFYKKPMSEILTLSEK